MEDPDYPFVSVIIPVFNDGERLKLCLAALAQQSYGRSHYEIIVVDNGSDRLEEMKAAVEPYGVVTTVEPIPGSYAARNKGISLAKGEIIAFTDADCIPAADWLAQGIDYLRSTPNCGQVIGKVNVFFADPQRPTLVELYESVTAFPQAQLLRQFHGGATANVFTWRQVIEQVGEFNPQLKSYGDLEWGQRIYAQGYNQVYAESVLVRHPARASFQEFYTRTRRLAGGYYDLKLKKAQSVWQRQIIFLHTLLQHLTPPVFFTINTLLDARLNGMGQKLKVSLMMVLARYISAWETLRLKLGGVSNRG
ncbi:MAG: glycosyltransferase [Pseudanabaenales cyanobacterium]|nr:glycosyltransferase [Pseudanabaenales cyanobacterium]